MKWVHRFIIKLGINRIKYLWIMSEWMSNEWMSYEQYFWDYYQIEKNNEIVLNSMFDYERVNNEFLIIDYTILAYFSLTSRLGRC